MILKSQWRRSLAMLMRLSYREERRMKIGDSVYVHGYVDEIRNDTVIIRNEGGYFGTVKSEIVEAQKAEDIVSVIRCKDCKFVGTDATCCLVCDRDGMGLRPFHVYHDDYCSYAERKEE
jgi:hypothetical protein